MKKQRKRAEEAVPEKSSSVFDPCLASFLGALGAFGTDRVEPVGAVVKNV